VENGFSLLVDEKRVNVTPLVSRQNISYFLQSRIHGGNANESIEITKFI
jgi:hypothetical protein